MRSGRAHDEPQTLPPSSDSYDATYRRMTVHDYNRNQKVVLTSLEQNTDK